MQPQATQPLPMQPSRPCPSRAPLQQLLIRLLWLLLWLWLKRLLACCRLVPLCCLVCCGAAGAAAAVAALSALAAPWVEAQGVAKAGADGGRQLLPPRPLVGGLDGFGLA